MAMKPVTVSQLNGYIKRILQTDPLLGNVLVTGEVSNLKFHGSGHVYFTLKDEGGKINCFLGSDTLKDISYELSDGMEITAAGYIYLYERGGTYSLNIRDIEVNGLGNLSVAFEKLKSKLMAEGLFDEKHKKPISAFPRKIAVITSETGAAVQDILRIIQNRNNIVDVLVYPVLVQGPGAAGEIAAAIEAVNRLFPDTDTIITGRGGGSMEELWAFNEEVVARSIFDSKIPVISAVGHEIDFTIADFVADKRAETPTAAAQMAVPDIKEVKAYMNELRDGLQYYMKTLIEAKEASVRRCGMEALRDSFDNLLIINKLKIESLRKDGFSHISMMLAQHRAAVSNFKTQLDALNPLSIIERGYGAILDGSGNFAYSAESFQKDDGLSVVFSDGKVDCKVLNTGITPRR